MLDPRRERSDLLGLPLKVPVPIHPTDEMGGLVGKLLCGVVEPTTQVREEPQSVRAPSSSRSPLACSHRATGAVCFDGRGGV